MVEKDIIAGRKTEQQKIPYRIDIKLKLPKDYLLLLKKDIDKTVLETITPQPVPPNELSTKELEELKVHGITKEQYEKDYLELMKDFGDKKHIW